MLEAISAGAALASATTAGASLAADVANQLQNCNVNICCALEIRNYHKNLKLTNPTTYIFSGKTEKPPAPVIRPTYREACLFSKASDAARGSVGVLSYDIEYVAEEGSNPVTQQKSQNRKKLLLLWSIPWGSSYYTWHAVGIDNYKACYDSYYAMYYESKSWFTRKIAGETITHAEEVYGIPVSVRASLSTNGKASWIVDLE